MINKIKILFCIFMALCFFQIVTADETLYGVPTVLYNPIDNTKFSSIQQAGSGYIITIDGKKQDIIYDGYSLFDYNNSGSLYMTLQKDGKWFYVENGVKSDIYDYLYCTYNKGFFCVANKQGVGYVIYNGKVLPSTYDKIEQNSSYFNFDENKNNNWVNMKKGGKTFFIINGEEISFGYNDYVRPYFSKDGKIMIITGNDSTGSYIYIKGKKIYYYTGGIMLGDKIAFVVKKQIGDEYFFYYTEYNLLSKKINSKKILDTTDIYNFTVYSDHYSYIKVQKNGQSLVIDGKESGIYDSLTSVGNTNDGQYLITYAEKNNNNILLINLKEYKKK